MYAINDMQIYFLFLVHSLSGFFLHHLKVKSNSSDISKNGTTVGKMSRRHYQEHGRKWIVIVLGNDIRLIV